MQAQACTDLLGLADFLHCLSRCSQRVLICPPLQHVHGLLYRDSASDAVPSLVNDRPSSVAVVQQYNESAGSYQWEETGMSSPQRAMYGFNYDIVTMRQLYVMHMLTHFCTLYAIATYTFARWIRTLALCSMFRAVSILSCPRMTQRHP